MLRRERVRDVAKVDAANEFLRRHVGEELPERFAFGLRVEIPDGVHDGGGGKMDRAFLGTDPAELAVAGDVPPELAEVRGDGGERTSDDQRRERADGGNNDLIPSTNGEGEPVALMRAVGFENDVGGGVIGIGIHRVRSIELARGGKADVSDDEVGDRRHVLQLSPKSSTKRASSE